MDKFTRLLIFISCNIEIRSPFQKSRFHTENLKQKYEIFQWKTNKNYCNRQLFKGKILQLPMKHWNFVYLFSAWRMCSWASATFFAVIPSVMFALFCFVLFLQFNKVTIKIINLHTLWLYFNQNVFYSLWIKHTIDPAYHEHIYCKCTQFDKFLQLKFSVCVCLFTSSFFTYWLSTNLEWFLFFNINVKNIILLRCLCVSVYLYVFACMQFFRFIFLFKVQVNFWRMLVVFFALLFFHTVFSLTTTKTMFSMILTVVNAHAHFCDMTKTNSIIPYSVRYV